MSLTMALALIGVAAGTLISEDATAVGAGVAVRDGHLGLWPVLVACCVGIYVGDLGLWAAGRFWGRRVLAWPSVRMHAGSVEVLGAWIDRSPATVILGSRFLPGTRLPLYIAAGLAGSRDVAFFLWALIAVLLWTPLIVGIGAALGAAAEGPSATWVGGGWIVRVLLVGLALGVLRGASRVEWRRWEFWPAWLFNLPVALWGLLLALRYRSLTVFTCANPGIQDGGVVGESKSGILAKLPQAWVMPWATLGPAALDARLSQMSDTMTSRGWAYPIVVKPDVGQRGTGVRWLRDDRDAREYLAAEHGRVVLQVPHDGPFEAGVFYVRYPHEHQGHIFSITDKRFPVVTGDGVSTIERLIASHPRYRVQASMFLARLGAERTRVPVVGERVSLGRTGNHCQGTEFLDGGWLGTRALERRIDQIARHFDGFYFGRFDVRYRDRAAFMAGEDLAIIELNGVTSEATHIYDPSGSLLAAWQTLMRQWSIAFAIGSANRARGFRPTSIRRLARLVWTFARRAHAHPLAD
jgi:membrane protein DedA with SNARE-associated domain